MLDVGKLATLRAVVAHGSFSAAGHAIGSPSRPCLATGLAARAAGSATQLVRRTQHGVHPTEAGRLLVGHAEAILDRLRSRRRRSRSSPACARGTSGSARSSPRSSTCPPSWRRCSRPPPGAVRRRRAGHRGRARRPRRGASAAWPPPSSTWPSSSSTPSSPTPRRRTWSSSRSSTTRSACCYPRASAGRARAVGPRAELARDTWIRAHHGSAARLVDHVLGRPGLAPAHPARRARGRAGRGAGVRRRRPRHHPRAPAQRPPRLPSRSRPCRWPATRPSGASRRRSCAGSARRRAAVVDALREVGRRRANCRT